MRNAEEFSGQRPDLARVLPAYRRPSAGDGPGTDRIRYAHSGALPRDEPFRPVTQGTAGHHRAHAEPGDARGVANGGSLGGRDLGGGDLGGEAWLTEFPPAAATPTCGSSSAAGSRRWPPSPRPSSPQAAWPATRPLREHRCPPW